MNKRTILFKFAALLIFTSALSGCVQFSERQKSVIGGTLIGFVVGAGIGGGVGAATTRNRGIFGVDKPDNIGVGLLAGAVVGAAIGAWLGYAGSAERQGSE